MNPNKMIVIKNEAFKAGVIKHLKYGTIIGNQFYVRITFEKEFNPNPLDIQMKSEKEALDLFNDILVKMNNP